MSNIWHDINPNRIRPEDFVAVIEIPKGSKKKYELDKETRSYHPGPGAPYVHPLSRQLRLHPPHLRR